MRTIIVYYGKFFSIIGLILTLFQPKRFCHLFEIFFYKGNRTSLFVHTKTNNMAEKYHNDCGSCIFQCVETPECDLHHVGFR